jgi:hypothetical protein
MLERTRTRTRFTVRSDEPCSGADRLAPADSEANPRSSADSGAGPLLPSSSRAALRSLGSSRTVLLTSVVSEAGP